jgi:hypothetical protein
MGWMIGFENSPNIGMNYKKILHYGVKIKKQCF